MWLGIRVALHVKLGFHVKWLWKASFARSSGNEVRKVSKASISIDCNLFICFQLCLASLFLWS
jgi:hypothetical protein